MSRPALLLLCQAAAAAASSTVQSEEVRAALDAIRVSVPSGVDTIALERFWRAAGEPHPSVRRTWIAAELAQIDQLLELSLASAA